jgi:hypothetical protein
MSTVPFACSSCLRRPAPADSSAMTAANAPLLVAELEMLTNSVSAAASALKRVHALQTQSSLAPQVP